MEKAMNSKKKRIISLFLAFIMMLSLVGCGEKKKKEQKKKELDRFSAEVLDEFEFLCTTLDVKDDILYIVGEKINDESLLQDATVSAETEIYKLLKYNLNTKEKKEIDILNDISNDNSKENSEYTYCDKVSVADDGKIEITAKTYINLGDDSSENFSYDIVETKYYYDDALNFIEKIDGEKTTMSDNDQNEVLAGECVDKDGNIYYLKYVFAYDENSEESYSIVVKNKAGEEIAVIEFENMPNTLIQLPDGRVAVNMWEDEGEVIKEIDIENKKIGDEIINLGDLYINQIFDGKDGTLLFTCDGYLYKCNVEDNKIDKVLNFTDSDMSDEMISYIREEDENTYIVINSDYNTSKTEIDRLTRVDKNSEEAKKEEIHLATMWIDSSLKAEVVEFNKHSDKYRIVIDSYEEMYEDEDIEYEEIIKKFSSDIISGKNIDIIDLSSFSSSSIYRNGACEDLTPYFEREEDLKLSNYLDNVVETYKYKGKIYSLPVSMYLVCYAGPKKMVGDDISWNMTEFKSFVESIKEGVEPIENLTCDDLLYIMISANLDEYIDYEKCECDFNNDDFVALLEMCKKYPNNEEYYDEEEEEYVSFISKIRDKKLVLDTAHITCIEDYLLEREIYGEDISYKGYPTKDGNGVTINDVSLSLAISSKSKNKDAAWKFIKTFYTKDYQVKNSQYNIPIRKDVLDEILEKEKNRTNYETDENGNKYYSKMDYDGVELCIPVPTDKDFEGFKELINSADKRFDYDEEIINMIKEEAEPFFKGDKSAKGVADVIQSRISIYIKETN